MVAATCRTRNAKLHSVVAIAKQFLFVFLSFTDSVSIIFIPFLCEANKALMMSKHNFSG